MLSKNDLIELAKKTEQELLFALSAHKRKKYTKSLSEYGKKAAPPPTPPPGGGQPEKSKPSAPKAEKPKAPSPPPPTPTPPSVDIPEVPPPPKKPKSKKEEPTPPKPVTPPSVKKESGLKEPVPPETELESKKPDWSQLENEATYYANSPETMAILDMYIAESDLEWATFWKAVRTNAKVIAAQQQAADKSKAPKPIWDNLDNDAAYYSSSPEKMELIDEAIAVASPEWVEYWKSVKSSAQAMLAQQQAEQTALTPPGWDKGELVQIEEEPETAPAFSENIQSAGDGVLSMTNGNVDAAIAKQTKWISSTGQEEGSDAHKVLDYLKAKKAEHGSEISPEEQAQSGYGLTGWTGTEEDTPAQQATTLVDQFEGDFSKAKKHVNNILEKYELGSTDPVYAYWQDVWEEIDNSQADNTALKQAKPGDTFYLKKPGGIIDEDGNELAPVGTEVEIAYVFSNGDLMISVGGTSIGLAKDNLLNWLSLTKPKPQATSDEDSITIPGQPEAEDLSVEESPKTTLINALQDIWSKTAYKSTEDNIESVLSELNTDHTKDELADILMDKLSIAEQKKIAIAMGIIGAMEPSANLDFYVLMHQVAEKVAGGGEAGAEEQGPEEPIPEADVKEQADYYLETFTKPGQALEKAKEIQSAFKKTTFEWKFWDAVIKQIEKGGEKQEEPLIVEDGLSTQQYIDQQYGPVDKPDNLQAAIEEAEYHIKHGGIYSKQFYKQVLSLLEKKKAEIESKSAEQSTSPNQIATYAETLKAQLAGEGTGKSEADGWYEVIKDLEQNLKADNKHKDTPMWEKAKEYAENKWIKASYGPKIIANASSFASYTKYNLEEAIKELESPFTDEDPLVGKGEAWLADRSKTILESALWEAQNQLDNYYASYGGQPPYTEAAIALQDDAAAQINLEAKAIAEIAAQALTAKTVKPWSPEQKAEQILDGYGGDAKKALKSAQGTLSDIDYGYWVGGDPEVGKKFWQDVLKVLESKSEEAKDEPKDPTGFYSSIDNAVTDYTETFGMEAFDKASENAAIATTYGTYSAEETHAFWTAVADKLKEKEIANQHGDAGLKEAKDTFSGWNGDFNKATEAIKTEIEMAEQGGYDNAVSYWTDALNALLDLEAYQVGKDAPEAVEGDAESVSKKLSDFPPEIRKEAEGLLAAKHGNYNDTFYELQHYGLENPHADEFQKQMTQQMIDFLKLKQQEEKRKPIPQPKPTTGTASTIKRQEEAEQKAKDIFNTYKTDPNKALQQAQQTLYEWQNADKYQEQRGKKKDYWVPFWQDVLSHLQDLIEGTTPEEPTTELEIRPGGEERRSKRPTVELDPAIEKEARDLIKETGTPDKAISQLNETIVYLKEKFPTSASLIQHWEKVREAAEQIKDTVPPKLEFVPTAEGLPPAIDFGERETGELAPIEEEPIPQLELPVTAKEETKAPKEPPSQSVNSLAQKLSQLSLTEEDLKDLDRFDKDQLKELLASAKPIRHAYFASSPYASLGYKKFLDSPLSTEDDFKRTVKIGLELHKAQTAVKKAGESDAKFAVRVFPNLETLAPKFKMHASLDTNSTNPEANYTALLLRQQLAILSLLPAEVQKKLSPLSNISFGSGKIYQVPGFEHLSKKTAETEQGIVENLYETAAGLYNGFEEGRPKTIVVVGRADSPHHAALHEVGHAIADIFGLENDPEAVPTNKRLYDKLPLPEKMGGRGNFYSTGEMITEMICKILLGGETWAEQVYDKPSVQWIMKRVFGK